MTPIEKATKPDVQSFAVTQPIAVGTVNGNIPQAFQGLKEDIALVALQYKSAISFSQIQSDNKAFDIVCLYTIDESFIYEFFNIIKKIPERIIVIVPYLLDTKGEDSFLISLRVMLSIYYNKNEFTQSNGSVLVTIIGHKNPLDVYSKINAKSFEKTHRAFQLIEGSQLASDTVNGNEIPGAKDGGDEILDSWLAKRGIEPEKRKSLIGKFKIEVSRAARPKWVGRLERGGTIATLTAPLFLKRVHAEDIAPDGTVHKETIRAIDPELMQAVELYISKRKLRGQDLGDAAGLNFVLSRPRARPDSKVRKFDFP